jgi:hypothetical protein
MRSPQRLLYAIVGVAFLLAGCGPVASNSSASASSGAGSGNKCQKWFTVRIDNDEHLELGDEFRISGPTPDGDYRLRPIGPNAALPKDHLVVKGSANFKSEIEISDPEHGQVTLHFYDTVVEFDNSGCPSRLRLDVMDHLGDLSDHGGDAVMD